MWAWSMLLSQVGREALTRRGAQPFPVDQVGQAHQRMLQVDLFTQGLLAEISVSQRTIDVSARCSPVDE